MSDDFVLNWGIVSCGRISQKFCTSIKVTKLKNHVIKACAARKLEDAKKFAESFNIENYYDSYDKLFADNQVNCVYVGTVNNAHKDVCLRAINAGKNVLCEKPMTLNAAEQEEVLAAAKNKGVFFMEGIWTRFFPIIIRLKEEIDKGTIGDLKFFSGNIMMNLISKERLSSKELGGGGILDIGIYPIQLACLLFNHQTPLSITTSGHLTGSGVDECCTIVLTYPGNKIAQINVSISTTLFAPSFAVGDKGVIQLPESSWCPTDMILPNGEKITVPLPECDPHPFGNAVGFVYQAEAVRKALAQGLKEHPSVTHDHSRLIMKIMDEARKQLNYSF